MQDSHVPCVKTTTLTRTFPPDTRIRAHALVAYISINVPSWLCRLQHPASVGFPCFLSQHHRPAYNMMDESRHLPLLDTRFFDSQGGKIDNERCETS